TGTGPSLSIVNPLDVLRQRLLLEIARRRMRQTQNMIQANRDFLESI
uniref:Diuretic hormone class 1 n=2 Tax=Diploptera punctata TaxID=6984 RepID=DIUH_DIPPU|nr:RecName: Full=Diuretic hormone class 1; AltName: Full=DH(46); AltName: Full=Diuretic hormone class I; AltName: Full=Diuretic peptide; Short=DP [Diploptera punctata]